MPSLRTALEQRELPLTVSFEVGTMETVKRYVALGLGVGVVPGICLTEDDLDKVEVVEIPGEL